MKSDAYPSILGKKKMEEKKPEDTEIISNYAQHFRDGVATFNEVFKNMPDCPEKQNAVHYYEIALMYSERMFNKAHAIAEKG